MKKTVIVIVICFILVLAAAVGCSSKNQAENIVFTAVIEEVSDTSILVTTTDDVGFDMASVQFEENVTIGFDLTAGQTVKLTIKPEIAESYPVQVQAVDVQLVQQADSDA